jgi:hypothetical protein
MVAGTTFKPVQMKDMLVINEPMLCRLLLACTLNLPGQTVGFYVLGLLRRSKQRLGKK